MAIATSAAVGIGVAAASAGMSFAQASKQNKLQKQAQRDAQKAMDEARKRLEPNYYAALSIQKEPYELQREALLSQGAQAIQAGVESERGAAATAGRVQAGMETAQQDIRGAMGKELTDLSKLTADEQSRLRDVNVQLDLEEAAGQQQMARDAAEAKAAAISQGMASATSALSQTADQIDLYKKQKNINPLTGFKKGSTMDSAALTGMSGVQRPSTIGMLPGANKPTLLQKNLNTPAPQNPFIYPNQPAYNANQYDPFNVLGQ
jgi:hypothetical protein